MEHLTAPPPQEEFLTCRNFPPAPSSPPSPPSAGVTLQPRCRCRRPGLDPSTMGALFPVGPLHCFALNWKPTKRLLSTQSCQVPREPESSGGGGQERGGGGSLLKHTEVLSAGPDSGDPRDNSQALVQLGSERPTLLFLSRSH